MRKKDITALINCLAIERYGVFLLEFSDMLKIVKLCEDNQIPVLGIDTFYLCNEKIIPVIEKSADFSTEDTPLTINEFFKKTDLSSKYVFEIVI